MKLKAISFSVLLAFGLNFSLNSPAQITQNPTTDVSKGSDLSQPSLSDEEILSWANSTAPKIYDYDHTNYRNELQKQSGFFTDSGYQQYLKALKDSKYLDEVKNKQLAVSAIVTAPPIILQKGVLNGIYSWRVQMPMTVSFKGANATDNTQKNNIVTMLITRTSSVNAPKGIAINNLVIGPAKSDKINQKPAQ